MDCSLLGKLKVGPPAAVFSEGEPVSLEYLSSPSNPFSESERSIEAMTNLAAAWKKNFSIESSGIGTRHVLPITTRAADFYT